MNKSTKISEFKKIKQSALTLKEVARQQMEQATRLEVLADSALKELGSFPGRRPKAKSLSDETKFELLTSITKGKSLA